VDLSLLLTKKNIKEVLDCFDFCDEIIIVDSYSTDKTEEIALNFPKVKFIKNKFEDFTKQRNLALKEAKNDWLLFLDADERLTTELKKEIIETINSGTLKMLTIFIEFSL
jgi:glycosyltransferase involved in cell wall biosynthesis